MFKTVIISSSIKLDFSESNLDPCFMRAYIEPLKTEKAKV